jgi:hypothetical protein
MGEYGNCKRILRNANAEFHLKGSSCDKRRKGKMENIIYFWWHFLRYCLCSNRKRKRPNRKRRCKGRNLDSKRTGEESGRQEGDKMPATKSRLELVLLRNDGSEMKKENAAD